MPELPEVETVKESLRPFVECRKIMGVTLRRKNLRTPFPRGFVTQLERQTIQKMGRRAKYILFFLNQEQVLIVHLGMSGRFLFLPHQVRSEAKNLAVFYDTSPRHEQHDHVIFHFSHGNLIYNDPRRFGFMDLIDVKNLENYFHETGAEPLDKNFTAAGFHPKLSEKNTSLKAALLDQKLIAGIGNIYASEALYFAGLSPLRLCTTLAFEDTKKLVTAIKKVLTKAIKFGGSTLKDYRTAEGAKGSFQHEFQVYDRAGEPCKNCQKPLLKILQNGRSTFYCRHCQR